MAGARDRAARAIRKNRRLLDRLLDRTVLRPLERIWGQGTDRIHRELAQHARQARRQAGSAVAMAEFHAVATGALADVLASVGDQLVATTGPVLTESVRGVADFMGTIRQLPGPLDDNATVAMISDTYRLHLEQMRLQTAASLGTNIDARITQSLTAHQFDKETLADIADMVSGDIENQWWQVERVVRTETAHAFNTGQVGSIYILEEDMPGIMKRWTELVDDTTGLPLDKRVAGDSIAMHGQVARPSDMFIMPAAPTAPGNMVGSNWPYPPNRPNDRAVVTPWMREWGIPGWQILSSGERVDFS